MTDSLIVLLSDVVVGTLSRLRGNRLVFEYDNDYQRGPAPTPLSVSMPVQIQSHPHPVITPWLWNLLPDNDQVIARWGRQFHVSTSSSTTPFALLATPVGLDCAGAVRFVRPDELEEQTRRPGSVTWLTEQDVADRLRDLKADSTAWLGKSFVGHFSLAGAQAKTALICNRGRWGVPHGSRPTTHILKPAVAGLDDHDLNEHICLDAARRIGMTAVRSRVESFCGETAIVIDRYDRRQYEERVARIHQEDLCQALGLPPTRKYQNEGGPTPGQVSTLFRRVMPPRAAEDAVNRFIDALAWNWVIGGTDGHAKNYSMLLSGGQVRLAPLYDIASALPYGHERSLRFAMKIGGDYRVFWYQNTWPKAASELGADKDLVIQRVQRIALQAGDAISDAAAAPDISALKRRLPSQLVDLVADRAKRCVELLEQTSDPG